MASSQSQLPDFMEALMRDPVKRAFVVELLTKGKDLFNPKGLKQLEKSTPTKKVKKLYCESPTAQMRRKALEQRDKDTTSEGSSSSDLSEVPAELKGPELPFEELLKGVIGYVEVNRDNQDRSDGIKAVMKLMGAVVRDSFTNDVTHVIFKDGSFNTYEKAKLLKIHLVSVLWLDAVRRNKARVPEKNYPAFGSRAIDSNVSVLCSQIQRDYEEIVKDERRRRHTLNTPHSSSTYVTARKSESNRPTAVSPELTSDDSDCGMINGEVNTRSNSDLLSELSDRNSSNHSPSLLSHVTVRKKRPTIHILSDMEITRNASYKEAQNTQKLADETAERDASIKQLLKDLGDNSLEMSSLVASEGSDRTKSGLGASKESAGNTRNCSVETAMSSLRLSNTDKEKNESRTSRSTSKTPSNVGTDDESFHPKRTKNFRRKILEDTIEDSICTNTKDSEEDISEKRAKDKENKAPTPEKEIRPIENIHKKTRRKTILPTVSETTSNSSSSKKSADETAEKTNFRNRRTTLSKPIDESSKLLESPKKKGRASSVTPFSNIPKSLEALKKKGRAASVAPLLSESSTTEDVESRTNISKERKNRRKTIMPKLRDTSDAELFQFQKRKSRASSETSENSKTSKDSTPRTQSESKKGKRKSVAPMSDGSNSSMLESPRKKGRPLRESSCDESPKKKGRPSRESSLCEECPKNKGRSSRKSSTCEQIPDLENTEGQSPVKTTQTAVPKSTRKLYNPNDYSALSPVESDKEREEHQKKTKQKMTENTFINPNTLNLTSVSKKTKSSTSDLSLLSSDDEHRIQKKKKKQSKKKKEKTPPKRNSADDEQRELLNLLDNALTSQRRSERISQSATKPKYTFSSGSSDSMSTSSLPISRIKRRSTLDFMSFTEFQKKKVKPKRTSSIVSTKLHRGENANLEAVVKQLGMFYVEPKVTNKTTHLIAGEPKRTINMLKAIARGCWVLKHEWLLDSQKAGHWKTEEDYELTEFSPAVQECRLQREAFGPSYSMDIFKNCGTIFITQNTRPKPNEMKELIMICGGRITQVLRNAEIVVGQFIDKDGVICVSEKWILDSIQYNKLKNPKKFLITADEDEDV